MLTTSSQPSLGNQHIASGVTTRGRGVETAGAESGRNAPLSLISPLPRLQYATATAVFCIQGLRGERQGRAGQQWGDTKAHEANEGI